MNPTHPGPAVPADGHDDAGTPAGPEATTVDTTSTPAAVLRRAAAYIQRYGWTTQRLYLRAPGSLWPAACPRGAIRIAVFGHTVEALYAHAPHGVDQAAYEANCEAVITAEVALALTIAAVDAFGADIDLTVWRSTELVGAWNDDPWRTADQVIGMLHTAASRCETNPTAATNPAPADAADDDIYDPVPPPEVIAPLIAVWATDGDQPPSVRVFNGDSYADWAETNTLSDAVPWPARFYAVTTDGTLTELEFHGEVSDYNSDDYATVTYTFTLPGCDQPYAIGVGCRDGRA